MRRTLWPMTTTEDDTELEEQEADGQEAEDEEANVPEHEKEPVRA
jgi:hypothetical protein